MQEYARCIRKLMDFITGCSVKMNCLGLARDAQMIADDIVLELPAFVHAVPKDFEYSQKCWASWIRAVEMLIYIPNVFLINNQKLNLILTVQQIIIGPSGKRFNLKIPIYQAKLLASQGHVYRFFLKHRECNIGLMGFKYEIDRLYSIYRQNSSKLDDLPQVSHVLLTRMHFYEAQLHRYQAKLRRTNLCQNLFNNIFRKFRFL